MNEYPTIKAEIETASSGEDVIWLYANRYYIGNMFGKVEIGGTRKEAGSGRQVTHIIVGDQTSIHVHKIDDRRKPTTEDCRVATEIAEAVK